MTSPVADDKNASVAEIESLLEAVLADRATATPVTFTEAPAPPAAVPTLSRRLGDRLLARGLVTVADLDEALTRQRERGLRLGEMLVEMGCITRAALAEVLAEHLSVETIDLAETPPDPLVALAIPEAFARRYRALAVQRSAEGLVVAMVDPTDVLALDDLRFLTGQPVTARLADAEQLESAIARAYQSSTIESTIDDAGTEYEEELVAIGDTLVEDSPIVRLVNAMFEQAIADRASDIHIEPGTATVRIRMRIDGVLQDRSEAPLPILRSLISRLKVLGGLDIAQSRVPQDGRCSITVQGRKIDVRVATLPTTAGEAAVLRILDARRNDVSLEALGLTTEEYERIVPHLHARQGAIVVTGPTGSGKSSTLYAMLGKINGRAKSIVSIEDPVEYVMDGIKQIQVNNRANMTFAGALRSVLRSDPDVIMVGEIRDGETAKIAASASSTGHLVLSTLHTTTTAATPMRLTDMGVEPYLVASALSCIVSQRLFRKLCEHCSTELHDPDLSLLEHLGATPEMLEHVTIRSSAGCAACHGTGYKGRMAVLEILPITEGIRRLIVERASEADIEKLAVAEGMDTLRVAALRRVVRGELSIDEMLRVVG